MSAIDDQSTFCSRAAISAVRAWRWRELMTPLASQDASTSATARPTLATGPLSMRLSMNACSACEALRLQYLTLPTGMCARCFRPHYLILSSWHLGGIVHAASHTQVLWAISIRRELRAHSEAPARAGEGALPLQAGAQSCLTWPRREMSRVAGAWRQGSPSICTGMVSNSVMRAWRHCASFTGWLSPICSCPRCQLPCTPQTCAARSGQTASHIGKEGRGDHGYPVC